MAFKGACVATLDITVSVNILTTLNDAIIFFKCLAIYSYMRLVTADFFYSTDSIQLLNVDQQLIFDSSHSPTRHIFSRLFIT